MRHAHPSRVDTDPVCGRTIDQPAPAVTCFHKGKLLCFCSASCREKFLERPGRYLHRRRCRRLPPRMSLPVARMKARYSQWL